MIANWRTYEPLTLPPALSAALECFVELGYHGTSVRAWADKAGMSVQGLYYHLPSKQSALVKLLERGLDELTERQIAALEEARNDPRSRFENQVENVIRFSVHRHQYSRLVREIHSLDDMARRQHLEQRSYLERTLAEDINRGVADGVFHVESPSSAARAVLVMCRGIATWINPASAANETLVREYVDYSLRIVGAPS